MLPPTGHFGNTLYSASYIMKGSNTQCQQTYILMKYSLYNFIGSFLVKTYENVYIDIYDTEICKNGT